MKLGDKIRTPKFTTYYLRNMFFKILAQSAPGNSSLSLLMKPKDINDVFKHSGHYLRNVVVDNVILGYHDKELKVLLQRPFVVDKWTVTGGYIRKTESIEEAADRVAFLRTGLKGLYLQQFRAFGNPKRSVDRGFTASQISKVTGQTVSADSWIFDYFVSVAFYTLTEFSKVEIKKSIYEEDCHWWPVRQLPPMMFDHKHIISEALAALRLHIAHYPIGYELLSEKFTLPEIHALYETILEKHLDERNFAKRLMATGIITKLNETKNIGAHRSPYLYTFNKKEYQKGLKTGIGLAF
jgi:8-oxo-dGTP diphosphatase